MVAVVKFHQQLDKQQEVVVVVIVSAVPEQEVMFVIFCDYVNDAENEFSEQ